MRNTHMIMLFLIFVLIIYFTPLDLHGQQDYHQMLDNAMKEFTLANFEAAIQILRQLKSQPSAYDSFSGKEIEKIHFYLAYCCYLLYGSNDLRTMKSNCDLKLRFPQFNPKDEEYQWVAQDWIDSLKNTDCRQCVIIEEYFNSGKNSYTKNNLILAVQELTSVRALAERSKNPPINCPEFGQYISFSAEYLELCQAKLLDEWNAYFLQGKYDDCLKIEKQINDISGSAKYLPKLTSHIESKGIEMTKQVNAAWNNYQAALSNFNSSTEFPEIDFNELQAEWNKWKKYNNIQKNVESQNLQNIQENMCNNYRKMGGYIIREFDIHEEERVKETLTSYKDFLITNFPHLKDEVEDDYKSIINSPSPVFDSRYKGVTPPGRDWEWRVEAKNPFIKKEGLQGTIICRIIIDKQGKVEKVDVREKKFNKDSQYISAFIDDLISYIEKREFKPATKIKYKPASATAEVDDNSERVNVKYLILNKFVLK